MDRFFLRPRWLALHAALVAVVVAFGLLGWWQLESAQDNDRKRSDEAKRVAVALETVAQPGSALSGGLAGQLVTVDGSYDASAQLLVPGREHDGRVGYYVVTPLRTPDDAAVAVNRGWVASPGDPAVGVPAGTVTVSGLVQGSEAAQASRVDGPASGLPEGQVAHIATSELTGRLPYPPSRLYDGFVLLRDQEPAVAVAPVPVPETADTRSSGARPWQNLSYALQWWLFALAAIFFWGSFLRHAAKDRRRAAAEAPFQSPGDAHAGVPAARDAAEPSAPVR